MSLKVIATFSRDLCAPIGGINSIATVNGTVGNAAATAPVQPFRGGAGKSAHPMGVKGLGIVLGSWMMWGLEI